MTIPEIKDQVIKKYHEGQEIALRIKEDERVSINTIKAKIIKFNPSSVLTEHNGYKESFTYWDILRMTAPPKTKETIIPERLKRRAKFG